MGTIHSAHTTPPSPFCPPPPPPLPNWTHPCFYWNLFLVFLVMKCSHKSNKLSIWLFGVFDCWHYIHVNDWLDWWHGHGHRFNVCWRGVHVNGCWHKVIFNDCWLLTCTMTVDMESMTNDTDSMTDDTDSMSVTDDTDSMSTTVDLLSWNFHCQSIDKIRESFTTCNLFCHISRFTAKVEFGPI